MCSARNKSSILFAFLHRWLQLQEQTQFGTIPFSLNAMHRTYLLMASFLRHLLFIQKSFLWFITKYPADKLILPHLTFQVIFNSRMINLTSAIAQDIWQQRWKFKNTNHMLKNAPFVPPIHSYSKKLPKPILSAIPTKTSNISNILWTGTLATKTQTTCWLSSTLEWRLSPMNGSNMFCSRNSVSNNVDDIDNDDGGDDDIYYDVTKNHHFPLPRRKVSRPLGLAGPRLALA